MNNDKNDENREPDAVWNIGGTTVRIFAPPPMSEEERLRRHKEVVRAVAACIRSAKKPASDEPPNPDGDVKIRR